MRKAPFILLLAAVAVLAGARSSRAQDTVIAHVPFAFVVDGYLMPAGDYQLMREHDIAGRVMEIMSRDGRAHALTIFSDSGVPSNAKKTALDFKTIGNQHFLWRVRVPGEAVYEIPVPTGAAAEAVLAKLGVEKGRKGD